MFTNKSIGNFLVVPFTARSCKFPRPVSYVKEQDGTWIT